MNEAILRVIQNEIEKIEEYPGYGNVLIKIEHNQVKIIEPTSRILITKDCPPLDKVT